MSSAAILEAERRGKAMAEAQLADVRERCSLLATENARLQALCNEMSFQCIMSGVKVPKEMLLNSRIQLPDFDVSTNQPQHAEHTGLCCMRHGNAVRPDPHMAVPSRRVFNDANLDSLCRFGAAMKLESVSLAGAQITDAGVSKVCRGLRNLTNLDLSDCIAVSDAVAPILSVGLTALETLDVSFTGMTGEGVSQLSNLPVLRELRCRGCTGMDDNGLTVFGGNENLKSLDCSLTGVSDKSVGRLHKDLPGLHCLGLAGCHVTDDSLASIGKLSELKCLNLSHCPNITRQGMNYLKNLTGLTALDLSYTALEVRDIGWIKDLHDLKFLNFGHAGTILEQVFRESHHMPGNRQSGHNTNRSYGSSGHPSSAKAWQANKPETPLVIRTLRDRERIRREGLNSVGRSEDASVDSPMETPRKVLKGGAEQQTPGWRGENHLAFDDTPRSGDTGLFNRQQSFMDGSNTGGITSLQNTGKLEEVNDGGHPDEEGQFIPAPPQEEGGARKKGQQVFTIRRTVVGGFARNKLVPQDDPNLTIMQEEKAAADRKMRQNFSGRAKKPLKSANVKELLPSFTVNHHQMTLLGANRPMGGHHPQPQGGGGTGGVLHQSHPQHAAPFTRSTFMDPSSYIPNMLDRTSWAQPKQPLTLGAPLGAPDGLYPRRGSGPVDQPGVTRGKVVDPSEEGPSSLKVLRVSHPSTHVCAPPASSHSLVAKLRHSLEQDMTFRAMEEGS